MKIDPKTYRGARCGLCYWALYDGDYCQNPDCQKYGKSLWKGEDRIHLTNQEAQVLIEASQETGSPVSSFDKLIDTATKYGLTFNGGFPEGEPARLWMFTDPKTKSTISVPVNATSEELVKKLNETREKFGGDKITE